LLGIMEERRWTGSHAVMAMLLAKGTSMSETDLVEPLRRELSARPLVVLLRENESCELRWHAITFCSAALYNACINLIRRKHDYLKLRPSCVEVRKDRLDRQTQGHSPATYPSILALRQTPVLKASASRLSEYISYASVSSMFIAIVHVSVGRSLPMLTPDLTAGSWL
jgi:hypothetical protein